MGDLQCPATILLIAGESIASGAGAATFEDRHLSGVHVASGVAADPGGLAAARLADERGWRLATMTDVSDGASLARAIDELADLHRGETIAVVGTREMIQDMLGEASSWADPITITVDASGWRVSRGGRPA
jgi:hypothetical protein